MSIPITLWAIARLTPGVRGFSFGLLTAGLFLGYLPVFFGVDATVLTPWLFAGGSLLSLLILRAGLRRAL